MIKIMTTEEIIKKKQHGDLKTAGAIIGIKEQNAYAALNRPGSKHHEKIKEILIKVISMREKIAKEATSNTQ